MVKQRRNEENDLYRSLQTEGPAAVHIKTIFKTEEASSENHNERRDKCLFLKMQATHLPPGPTNPMRMGLFARARVAGLQRRA